jgi:hypothetical protein
MLICVTIWYVAMWKGGSGNGSFAGAARCYTGVVPTALPRHTITETPPVREALDELRSRMGRARIDYAELVILGARVKTRQLPDDEQAARAAARRLATRIRNRSLHVEVEAADKVKYLGLIAD